MTITLRYVTIAVFAFTMMAAPVWAQAGAGENQPAWDSESLDMLATLAKQDGGRVKPLDTFAQFLLLRLNGKRSVKVGDHRMKPIEWLADTMFYPETAKHYKVFAVKNPAVLDAISVPYDKGVIRDRISYAELEPGRQTLFMLAADYDGIEEKDRDLVQTQIVNLRDNMWEYEQVLHFFDFTSEPYVVPEESPLAAFIPDGRYASIVGSARQLGMISLLLERGIEALEGQVPEEELEALREALPEGIESLDPAARTEQLQALQALFAKVDERASRSRGLAIMPPTSSHDEWLSPADVLPESLHAHAGVDEQVALLARLEDLYHTRNDRAAFKQALTVFHDEAVGLAESRGEYGKIPLEVLFYKLKFFLINPFFFAFAFMVVALSWMAPRSKALSLAGPIALAIPTLLLCVGITMRCIIRGRPPVSTLYESILFIVAVAAILCIIAELVMRRKIAISLGAALGVLGVFLANKYETQQGVDTMPSLVAVLDTNFWLATHVTTVTMGYAAGLLAAGIAHVYIVGRLITGQRAKTKYKDFFKGITVLTYGVLCFGIVFATVGTILGGIWANDSWGRFWGWDPKENGALMIVLAMLAILHARLGGYIRDLGIAIWSVACGMVVAFSWWHVNHLGVGLHSYGFTSGIIQVLTIFYATQLGVMTLGAVVWLRERFAAAAAEKSAPAGKTKPAKATTPSNE